MSALWLNRTASAAPDDLVAEIASLAELGSLVRSPLKDGGASARTASVTRAR